MGGTVKENPTLSGEFLFSPYVDALMGVLERFTRFYAALHESKTPALRVRLVHPLYLEPVLQIVPGMDAHPESLTISLDQIPFRVGQLGVAPG